jgi:hypothetical protein
MIQSQKERQERETKNMQQSKKKGRKEQERQKTEGRKEQEKERKPETVLARKTEII